MEPRTVRKATIYQLLLSGVGAILILVLGFLWYQNAGIIKDVQAQCVKLQDTKIGSDRWDDLMKRLDRIEKKIDRM